MKNLIAPVLVIILIAISYFNKPQFTDVKIITEDGSTYTAHVVEPNVSVPDTGEIIPIIKTNSTNGYLFNSKGHTLESAVPGFWFHKEVVFGKVTEIIEPKV